MKIIRYVFFLGLLLMASCATVRYLEIETQQPPRLLLPSEVQRMLLVNHAVAQKELVIEAAIKERAVNLKQVTDSLTFLFCRMVGEGLASTLSLEDVRLLEQPLATKEGSYSAKELTPAEVALLCEEHGVDAVFSLDRLLLKASTALATNDEGRIEEFLELALLGTMRLYQAGVVLPMDQFILDDTLTISLGPFRIDPYQPEAMREALKLVLQYKSEELIRLFTTCWREEERWVYLSPDARWKEGDAAAKAGDWVLASTRWQQLYQVARAPRDRMRLASNVALAEEMRDHLPEALSWATIAYRAALEESGEGHLLTKGQKSYMENIKKRYEGVERIKRLP